MNRWLTFLSVSALFFLAVNSASATLIAYDDFESYTAGNDLNGGSGGTGWGSNNWTGGAGDVTVESGKIPGYGKSMQITDAGSTGKIISRALGTSQTGTVYVGMLFRVENLDNDDFVQFYTNNGGADNEGASMGARNNPNNPLFVRVSGITDNSSTNAVNDVTFQLVMKIEKTGITHASNYDHAELFIDRATESTLDANINANSTTATLSAFNVRTHSFDAGADAVFVDELRIATTFSEAANLPAAPSYVAADYNDLSLGLQQTQFGGIGLSAADDWSGTGTIDVISGDLTAPAATNYALTQSGTPQSIIGDWNEGRRNIRDLASALTDDTVWFSFLAENQAGDSRGGISFNGSGGSPQNPLVRTDGAHLFVNGSTVANDVFTTGQTALVLGRITVSDTGNDTWDIWVDPDVSGGESGLPAATATVVDNTITAAGITRLGNISYHTGTGGVQNGAIIDMIRLSDGPNGFADVTGVPEPSTFLMSALGLLGLLACSRRRKR